MWWLGVVAAIIGQNLPDISSSKVFLGPAGERVEVVALKPVSKNLALIRVTNADSAHDGLVMPCEVRVSGSNSKYATKHNGSGWIIMSLDGGRADVEVPGRPAFVASFNKKATAALEPEQILAAQREQEASGVLRLFQRQSYPKMEAKYEGLAQEAAAKLSKRCGHTVSMRFDWGSFSDEVMGDVNAWKACAPIVDHLERSCDKVKQADEVVCRMGTSFRLELKAEAKEISFTTTPAGQKDGPSFLSKQR
ncbi:MAG: hypothetical protein H6729_16205 [Deltaproteobacteria bacterium]|nr:hypothetical protein [Deltaproteobacteria bacterium]